VIAAAPRVVLRASEAGEVAIRLETPMPPPIWAILERELLRANVRACEELYPRSFDDHGYRKCVERRLGADGTDDAIEMLSPGRDYAFLTIIPATTGLFVILVSVTVR